LAWRECCRYCTCNRCENKFMLRFHTELPPQGIGIVDGLAYIHHSRP
jgi:hypothetical protein